VEQIPDLLEKRNSFPNFEAGTEQVGDPLHVSDKNISS
jgi:hypothetical protein